MIVVDTLVIASFWLPVEFSDLAVRALKKDAQWAAPYLWRSQFRNLVAARIRREDFHFEFGLKFLASAEGMLRENEFFVPYGQVMEQVKKSSCNAYQSEFVALAEDLNVRLVTLDSQILSEFPKRAIHLSRFIEN